MGITAKGQEDSSTSSKEDFDFAWYSLSRFCSLRALSTIMVAINGHAMKKIRTKSRFSGEET